MRLGCEYETTSGVSQTLTVRPVLFIIPDPLNCAVAGLAPLLDLCERHVPQLTAAALPRLPRLPNATPD